jgi:hypothetical protein
MNSANNIYEAEFDFPDTTNNFLEDINEELDISNEGYSNESLNNENLNSENPSNESHSNEDIGISDNYKKKIIFRKPRQKTSPVWKYFDDKGSYVICNVIVKNKANSNGKKCGQKYATSKSTSTSTMTYHLKQVHQITFENNVCNIIYSLKQLINIFIYNFNIYLTNLFYIKKLG